MVGNGQRGVIDIAYDNRGKQHTNIEVLSFDALRLRLKRSVARRPSRLDFHQVVLVRGGTGTAMVDFVTYPCVPGTLLHLRPGQVQRLPYAADGRPADLDATLVLFTADFPRPLPETDGVLDGLGPVAWELSPDDLKSLDHAVTDLHTEYATLLAGEDAALTGALLRQLTGALLLRMARLENPSRATAATPDLDVYLAFRREVEQRFTATRSTEQYASRLGYSPRTLTRACQAATGRTAKQLLDNRVVLEAQRLLAHTELPVATIARTLGFSEPTNFGKFFTRATGQSPGAFRRTQRGSAAEGTT